MKDLNSLVHQILDQGYLMSLATVDENGPWVADVIYVYDDQFNLYWISKTETRHSQAILKRQEVAASITVSNGKGEDNVGLQLAGTAEKLEGDDLVRATLHYEKRGKPAPKAEGEILDKGRSWYKLAPNKIEVIYEPYWGFEKQVFKS